VDIEQVKILLDRYNQGICTPEETEMVEQWFDQVNQDQSTRVSEGEFRQELSDIKSRIDRQIAPSSPVRRMRRWYAAAAIAAVLVVTTGIIWFNQRKPVAGPIVNAQPIKTPAIALRTIKNGSVEISTPRMVKDTVTLQDGSTIVLNSGSRLRYPEHFSDTERSIWLEEGEAYFDAAADPGKPFVVHTGPLTTTVLGTTFNIRTYAIENKVTVALFTGKVKVDHLNKAGNQATSLELRPSEQVSFDRRQFSIKKTSFAKPDEVAGWKKGYLVFKDASFDEIATGLKNHFGVTLINQSSKTEWDYTGIFQNESLKDVMKILCLTKSLSYAIKSDTVYLVNKN